MTPSKVSGELKRWGWHYEEPSQEYVFYDLKDGEAKMWIAAEVAESAPPDTLDPQLHRLIERVTMIPKRAETAAQKALILKALLDIWKANPNLRLGQLLEVGLGAECLFSIEDADLIGSLLASEYLDCPE